MVTITVRDYGLGIPPEQAPLLFHRFARLPRDLASTTIGNGLGLYLCRELAEAMGGRLWFESVGIEGQGTTFYLELPLPPTTLPLPTTPASSATPESLPPAESPPPAPPPSDAALTSGFLRVESMPLPAIKSIQLQPIQSAPSAQTTDTGGGDG